MLWDLEICWVQGKIIVTSCTASSVTKEEFQKTKMHLLSNVACSVLIERGSAQPTVCPIPRSLLVLSRAQSQLLFGNQQLFFNNE
jgi:hypothetical protein